MSEIDRVFLFYVLPAVVGWALGIAMVDIRLPLRWQERLWIVGGWCRHRRALQEWADLESLERDEWASMEGRQRAERQRAVGMDLPDEAMAALADVHEIEQAHMRQYFESYREMVALPAARRDGITVGVEAP